MKKAKILFNLYDTFKGFDEYYTFYVVKLNIAYSKMSNVFFCVKNFKIFN